jgi:hypothetical protein
LKTILNTVAILSLASSKSTRDPLMFDKKANDFGDDDIWVQSNFTT